MRVMNCNETLKPNHYPPSMHPSEGPTYPPALCESTAANSSRPDALPGRNVGGASCMRMGF